MLMSFRILLFISLFSTFVSCVPKKESDFTKFKAPELQKANNLNTPEERPIELEIPPMEIGEDAASKKMGERYNYRIVKAPRFGKVTNCLVGQDRSCTYHPNKDFFGVDEFSYIAFDGPVESNVITIKIDVININDPPSFIDGELYKFVNEDEYTLIELEQALDVDRDELEYEIAETPKNGYIEKCFEKGLSCFYQPNENYTGKDRFTYFASDGEYKTSFKIVNITVNPSNDRPRFEKTQLTFNTPEDTPIKVSTELATDAEDESNSLAYVIVNFPRRGTLKGCAKNSTEWSCKYSPSPNFYGNDFFRIIAVDSSGEKSEPLRFDINVSSVADAPYFEVAKQVISLNEDTLSILRLEKAIDVDNDIKHYRVKRAPASGTLYDCLENNLDTVCSYKPAKDFYGKVDFEYEVVDRSGLKASLVVELNINPINDPPVVVYKNLHKKVTEDVVLKFNLSQVKDVDDKTHTYYNFSKPLKGSLKCSGRSCEYTPKTNFSGSDSFTYSVKDSGNLTDNGKILLSVEEVDDPPALADKVVDLFEDNTLIFDLPKAMDIDSSMHTYKLAVAPKNGTLSDCFIGNKIKACKYTPKANFYGKDTFRFTAKDTMNVATGTVTLNVLPVNDFPYWKHQNELAFTVYEDTPKRLMLVEALDLEDGDSLEYVLVTQPKNGSFEEGCFKNGKINCVYTPKENFYGADVFLYKAVDSSGYSTSIRTVKISILPVDDVPTTSDLKVTLMEDTPKRFSIPKALDDSPSLSYEESVAVKNGVVSECFKLNKIKNCLYTPKKDFYGSDELVYSVNDSSNKVLGKLSFEVTPVNDKPKWDTYADLVLETKEDTPLLIGFTAARDVEDGRDLEYDYVQLPSRGTLDLQCLVGKNLNCIYTPNRNVYGVDTIKYIAKDKAGEKTVVKEITINITPVNDPPKVDELVKKTKRNQPISFKLQPINDVDSTNFILNYKATVANGTLTGCVSGQRIYINMNCVYTPNTDFEGVDGFEFDVVDLEHTVRAKVTINVEDPYIKEERIEINVKEREKPLIKIAVLVDTTESMKPYQNKLVQSLTPMFEKLHSYNVELHLYPLTPLLTSRDFISNYKTDENFIYGRVILDREQPNVTGGKFDGLQRAIFKVDPKASVNQVKNIAKEIALKIESMGASDEYSENGLHQMGFLLSHPESPFNEEQRFGGFVVLSNENSYASDSYPSTRPAIEYGANYTFSEYRRRAGETRLSHSSKRRDGDKFARHVISRAYYKSKIQKYTATYSNRDGQNSSYDCSRNYRGAYDFEASDGQRTYINGCSASREDLPQGFYLGDDIVCASCIDASCSNFHGFKESYSYDVPAVINAETKEIVTKAFTVTCKKSGVTESFDQRKIFQRRYAKDGFAEGDCQKARESVKRDLNQKGYYVTKMLPENSCIKEYSLPIFTSNPPSINEYARDGNGPVEIFPLVKEFLEKNQNGVGSLHKNQVLNELLLELIDQKIGLENAYTNFIIHNPELDLAAKCSDVVGKLGATNGNAYEKLHNILVDNGIASSSINSICSGDYSSAFDGLKTFIEEKTDNVFLTGIIKNQRLYSVEVTRDKKKLNLVKNRDFNISKDGATVTFKKGFLEPSDKIVFVIRTYE